MRFITQPKWPLALATAVGLMFAAGQAQAAGLDLTSVTTTPVLYQGAYFSTYFDQTSGTGAWDPFADLQNYPVEEGYNTDASFVLDQHRTAWNRDVTFGELDTTMVGGVPCYIFELDSNETGQGNLDRLLVIDDIRVYSRTSAITDADGPPTDPGLLGTEHWALDNPLDGSVLIDSTIGATGGSGSADLIVFIPTSKFGGVSDSDYLYFYNKNGGDGFTLASGEDVSEHAAAHSGFEEWRVWTKSVPEPSSALAGLGALLFGFALRRRIGA